ncbi:hypothetical protein GIB67_005606 [Kingdonia uniflora]|uniref:CCAAT-binding factor domain-containing protein n=1 Tax=Kingdonia uniflora TaxID=39325 RepID=A0A7J7NIA1_9MAGN|nr:hypothetical protein GIB67_005606 [Kingdonia uniflora]
MGVTLKTNKPESPKDIDLLKSDVASFASSIGLSSASIASGFNDTDFRDPKPLKPQNIKAPKPQISEKSKSKPSDEGKKKRGIDLVQKPKFPTIPADSKQFDRWKSLPKLPLTNANSLGVWYVEAEKLEEKVTGKGGEKKIEARSAEQWKSLVAKNKELAVRLLAQFTHDFELSKGRDGDIKMLFTTQRSGTASDKVSAFSVMVGENPVATLWSLDALLALVTSKVGKRHALTGFEALKELFLSSLLPDRKLKSLFQRPLNHLAESKDGNTLLLLWHFEECLKQRYELFVFALEEASRDMLPILKDKALKTMYSLLRSKSEQERRLLSALVNKLGDPQNKGASNADFHLTNLLSVHPNMKAVVIDEVDSFLFRPHLGFRAKYHAVNFLSQIRLNHKGDGPKVAKRLVDVYFALFKVLVSEASTGKTTGKISTKDDKKFTSSLRNNKEESTSESNVEMDSRLLSALLTNRFESYLNSRHISLLRFLLDDLAKDNVISDFSELKRLPRGVNRAFPFVGIDEVDDVVEIQTPMLFKLVHSKNFNVGVQALMLLDKISSKNQIVSDRFYRALYSKLLLPAAMNSSKAEMFIGLIHRAMKTDVNFKRVCAFSKRLLQVALQQPPQFACGCLFLLSELLKARPPLWNMVLQSESIDEDVEHFVDVIDDDPKSEELGPSPPKHLIIQAGTVQNGNNCAEKERDSSSDSDSDSSPASESENDDFDGDDNLIEGKVVSNVWEFKTASDFGKIQTKASNIRSFLPGGYDPRLREPSYCNADRAGWWELVVLASHSHPSVATMSKTLLSGANIVYNGNPLNDLSLPAFLDKFMEKKPKAATWHGGSQIEPAKKMDTSNQFIGAEILELAEENVPPEDFYFHKFYMNKMSSSKKPKKKKKKKTTEDEAAEEILGGNGTDESDNEDIGGDESDNEEIENMLNSGDVPSEAEGDYDYDDFDKVADEDDEDLIGNESDVDTDLPSDFAEEEDMEDEIEEDGVPGIVDTDDSVELGLHKRKTNRKSKASPFASLEDYDHLFKDEEDSSTEEKAKPKHKLRKKRKPSSD